MPEPVTKPEPLIDGLLPRFGLDQFRPGQREVIEAILAGRDTLCIMPTGGGKSLCYQLPALARPGVTLVISPLIALMKDQVDALVECGIAATCINSSVAPADQQYRLEGLSRGAWQLVYIAPERLRQASFLRALEGVTVQMLAVDEAHCISQWGHDFRPDYARLGRFRQRLGNPQTVALTATATATVQQDICAMLELKDPVRFVSGFARPNLSLAVETPAGNVARDRRLVEFIRSEPGGGIIYASTRKNCEHVVELLTQEAGIVPQFYHAGMEHDARREVQERFMTGKTRVVVATNAFGMGIDKPDLRFVVHYNLPGGIEAYYQEAGRAGRDGLPSRCLMLYAWQDRFIQEFFIENSYPSRDVIRQVYEFLVSCDQAPVEITLQEIKDQLGLSLGTQGIANCEHLLEKAGAIERLDSLRNMAGVRIVSELPTLVDLLPRTAKVRRRVLQALERQVGPLRGEMVLFDPRRLAERLDLKWESVQSAIRELTELAGFDYVPPFRGRAIHIRDRTKSFGELEIDFVELEQRRKAEFERLEQVIRFATGNRCRQLMILEYFGEQAAAACGHCDRCVPGIQERDQWRPQVQPAASPEPATGSVVAGAPAKERPGASADAATLLYAVQVALSGAVRTRGRLGKTLIAEMLVGSNSRKMAQFGLRKLSTWGLLKPLKKDCTLALLDWLIAAGHLQQTESGRFRPIVQITPRGRELMAGRNADGLAREMPAGLARQLSALLRGHVPDSVSRPDPGQRAEDARTGDQPVLANVPEPVSPPVAVVASAPEAASSAGTVIDPKTVRATSAPAQLSIQPTCYWTWRLFADGYSAAEVAVIRGLDESAIAEHLERAVESGLAVAEAWLLSSSQVSQLESWLESDPASPSATLRRDGPSGISPALARLFRSCRRQRSVP